MVANLTPASIRATAFGTLPWPTTCSAWPPARSWSALLADKLGLVDAMKIVPLVSVLAIVALLIGRRAYPSSLRRAGAAAVGLTHTPPKGVPA